MIRRPDKKPTTEMTNMTQSPFNFCSMSRFSKCCGANFCSCLTALDARLQHTYQVLEQFSFRFENLLYSTYIKASQMSIKRYIFNLRDSRTRNFQLSINARPNFRWHRLWGDKMWIGIVVAWSTATVVRCHGWSLYQQRGKEQLVWEELTFRQPGNSGGPAAPIGHPLKFLAR
jgi:hypothetical protein